MSAVVVSMQPRKPGRKPIDDERNALRIFPTKAGIGAGLYAIGFTDGRVKFGKARHPRARVLAYWHQTGGAIAWAHYFGCVEDDYYRGGKCWAEGVACEAAAEIGRRINRSEYFTGLTKQQAISIGRSARSADLVRRNTASA